jgi:DNA primase
MRFSDEFLRTVKERTSIVAYAGARLSWDRGKSKPSQGDYWACCPFHHEKSASFHVRDRTGTYKCFGCGEAGGVIDLAMHMEGLSFPEAVTRLAELSGIPLPREDDPRAERAERQRAQARAACAKAAELYARALHGPEAGAAREYLERRGLGPAEWEAFGVGYAPGGWTWLFSRLRDAGFDEATQAAAGLIRPAQNGKRAIDIFRERITFRIDDAMGKPIAFGGRALDPNDKAKYINSPESVLFHKGRTLYRLKEAREALAKAREGAIVVTEGYFDVIAFARAGVAAVAPLGTALTEEQLDLLWRACPEPVLCFDGDAAGRRAAHRALDVALPKLGPDRTVRVALMPDGLDPDDAFRKGGAAALAAVIAEAKPAGDALFAREFDLRALTTPEAKAGFKQRLKSAIAKIADEDTRRAYMADLLAKADAAIRPPKAQYGGKGGAKGGARRGAPPIAAGPTPETKARAAPPQDAPQLCALLGVAVDHPAFVEARLERFAALPVEDPALRQIHGAVLALVTEGVALDRAAASAHLAACGAVDAAARVHHLPRLAVKGAGARVAALPRPTECEAESVQSALPEQRMAEKPVADAAFVTPEDLKAPGATRDRVAQRARGRTPSASPRLTAREEAEADALLEELIAAAAPEIEDAPDPLAALQARALDDMQRARARAAADPL